MRFQGTIAAICAVAIALVLAQSNNVNGNGNGNAFGLSPNDNTYASIAYQFGFFGKMFENLPPIANPDPGTTAEVLTGLANTMFDDNVDSENSDFPAFFTFFGQFVDHDMTRDNIPSNVTIAPEDIINARTLRFDLDSVYGNGKIGDPQLYNGDRFILQEPNPNGVRDLQRNSLGVAIIPDGRNDENQIISQIQVAFLKFHNTLIDRGLNFAQARRTMIRYYQWIVLNEYLPLVTGRKEFDEALERLATGTSFYNPGPNRRAPMAPAEFAVAAFRFGHTQVRRAYRLNFVNNTGLQVFNLAVNAADLRGGKQLQSDRAIDWGMFLPELYPQYPNPPCLFEVQKLRGNCANLGAIPNDNLPIPTNCSTPEAPFTCCCPPVPGVVPQGRNASTLPNINFSRKIDAMLSSGLFTLPVGNFPGAAATPGDPKLGFRNMLRAQLYGLPSGQAVAAALGVTPIPPERIRQFVVNTRQTTNFGGPQRLPNFPEYFRTNETPLWYYILVESGMRGGKVLGPVGSKIVLDTFLGVLAADTDSIINRPFTPRPPIAPALGKFTAADFLKFAGVATLA